MQSRPWLRALTDPWLPRSCLLCDARLGIAEDGPCDACRQRLPGGRAQRCTMCGLRVASPSGPCPSCTRRTSSADRTLVVADYASPTDRLVLALKFGGEIAVARALGHLIAQTLHRADVPWPDALVPVPLGHARLAQRGYNQSLEIAHTIGRHTRLPVARDWLRRVRETPAQSLLALSAREANLAGAFEASPAVHGKRIALVDDVMTSGATLDAAARALKSAGACFVVNLVFARTP